MGGRRRSLDRVGPTAAGWSRHRLLFPSSMMSMGDSVSREGRVQVYPFKVRAPMSRSLSRTRTSGCDVCAGHRVVPSGRLELRQSLFVDEIGPRCLDLCSDGLLMHDIAVDGALYCLAGTPRSLLCRHLYRRLMLRCRQSAPERSDLLRTKSCCPRAA